MTREDVMAGCAAIAALAIIFAGMCFDADKFGLMWSFIVISVSAVFTAGMAYLHPSKE